MSISTSVKKICEHLGKMNKATYAVVAIAVAKGILRPIFTLADKHETKETKKYAAAREGLTEVVAIPTYLGVGKLSETIAGKLQGLSPEKLELAKHNANFIGVCIAALFVIPFLASIVAKPFSKNVKNNSETNHKLDIKEKDVFDGVIRQNDISGKNNTIQKPYNYVSMEGFMPTRPEITKVGALW